MSRMARVFVENACNHITARSVQRDTIFRENNDFMNYFYAIHRMKIKFGCRIYCYCIMPNHIHLVLESPLGLRAMSKFMHNLNQSYAMRFNGKYKRVGHLWQNRYKNFIVLKDEYMIRLCSYVEMNPVRAGIVKNPEDYPWSSYRSRVLGEKNIILDTIDFTLTEQVGGSAWGQV